MTTTEDMLADPLWEIAPSGEMSDEQWQLFRRTGNAVGCGESTGGATDYEGDEGTWTCTRGRHPNNWRHIASSGRRYIIGTWGGISPEPEGVDPEPEPFEPIIGALYKFRNRATTMMMIGLRGPDKVEVLDLTHQRYRLLSRDQLIPRRADAEPPPPEQMRWVATFMAERREQVRTTAIAQRSSGYFKTAEDLNKVLGELNLEPAVSRRVGLWQPAFRLITHGMSDQMAHERLMAWMASLPEPPAGIEVRARPSTSNTRLELRDEST